MPSSLPFLPTDLGLPAKFSSWRPGQDDAINNGIDSPHRFIVQNMPTGTGKSACGIAQAVLTGRTAILTASKGLQTQYLNDFSSMGLVDIRGRNNYTCHMSAGMTCEDGAHAGCIHQETDRCAYHCARQAALDARCVVTNYSYWSLVHKYGEGLGKFDLLICDEAHSAPQSVCDVMAVHFTPEEISRHCRAKFPRDSADIGVWRLWALQLTPIAEREEKSMAEYLRNTNGGMSLKDIRLRGLLKNLVSKLKTISSAHGDWGVEPDVRGGYKLEPLWASDYAEQVLFRGVPKILLISATVIHDTMRQLGVKEYDYQQYPYVFPYSSSPLIHVPTVAVTHRTFQSQGTRGLWLHRIDQLIADRLDRKGIIHTVSYDRKNMVMEASRFVEHMISHQTADAISKSESFKLADPPKILLSPSMTTGYDFPGPQCEYQILCKVPHLDKRSPITAARCKLDKLYEEYSVAQTLTQCCGRGMRGKGDRCENICIDDLIRGFFGREYGRRKSGHPGLVADWFLKLYRHIEGLPRPLPKL
jgi:ATP-dependent DNA helicase DinG